MRSASRSTRAAAAVLGVTLVVLAGCGQRDGAALPPSSPVPAAPLPAAAPAAPVVPAAEDPEALWSTWKRLNLTCRGSSGPESETACARRSVVQERQARLVAAEFFDAWKQGDTATMARLTHPDNATETAWRIPGKLATYTPTEQAFDCRYDLDAVSPFGCYTAVTGIGADLYVKFDIDDDRGWLARSFGPDV